MDFAGKLQEFVFRMLADSLRSRVEPVAAALDGRPSAATLEEGRRDAGTRAGRIGDALAGGRGVADAYLAARALLQDLWAVAAEDAVAAAPAVGAWIRDAVGRALARSARPAAEW